MQSQEYTPTGRHQASRQYRQIGEEVMSSFRLVRWCAGGLIGAVLFPGAVVVNAAPPANRVEEALRPDDRAAGIAAAAALSS